MAALDLNDVAAFVRVVERSGFAKAARELGVPTSTLSRAVARLEAATGTRLVYRNTRAVTPTSEGQAFYAEVAPAMLTLQQAARAVDGNEREVRGRLRVSAPNDLGSTFVAGLVAGFTARYPLVDVNVELSMRQVNLVREGFDLALRASEKLNDSSLVARKAGDLEAALYASPGYLSAWGAPTELDDLDAHRCVLFRPDNGEAIWTLHGPEGVVERRVRGRIGGDDHSFVRGAALAGAGVALLPHLIAADDVASGRLVHVLPQYAMRGAALYVVYAAARVLPAKISAFRDFALQSCGSNAPPPRGSADRAPASLLPPAPQRPPSRSVRPSKARVKARRST